MSPPRLNRLFSKAPTLIPNFLILSGTSPAFAATVLAVGAVSPTDTLAEVEAALTTRQITGTVLFDLLLAHGNKTNRFFQASFDGIRFTSDKLKPASDRYAEHSAASAKMLQAHAPDMDLALLSPAMQYAVRTGIPL